MAIATRSLLCPFLYSQELQRVFVQLLVHPCTRLNPTKGFIRKCVREATWFLKCCHVPVWCLYSAFIRPLVPLVLYVSMHPTHAPSQSQQTTMRCTCCLPYAHSPSLQHEVMSHAPLHFYQAWCLPTASCLSGDLLVELHMPAFLACPLLCCSPLTAASLLSKHTLLQCAGLPLFRIASKLGRLFVVPRGPAFLPACQLSRKSANQSVALWIYMAQARAWVPA